MRKIFLYSCLCFLISIFLIPISVSSAFSEDAEDWRGVYEYENLKVYKGNSYLGALRNARGNAIQQILGDFEFCFSRSLGYRDKDTEITLKALSFYLSEVRGLRPTDIRNISLILDKNNNAKWDSGDEVVAKVGQVVPTEIEKDNQGNVWLKNGSIAFEQDIVIPENRAAGGCTRFILVADLYDLEEGDKFTISFDKHSVEDYEVPSKATDVTMHVDLEFKHYVGNRAPSLKSPVVSSNYDNLEGTEFRFEVTYSDPDNDSPAETLLKIDLDGDGKYEKYKMEKMSDKGNSWTFGERFKIDLPLNFIGSPIKFKFAFSDGKKWAKGEAVEEQSVPVMPWVLIPPFSIKVNLSKCLPGQKIRLVAGVIRHLDAKVDWFSLEGKEFSGFRVEKVILGKRSVSADLEDFEIIHPLVIVISPTGTDFGIRKIGSLKFPFKVEGYGDEKNIIFEKEIFVPEFKFELVPIIGESKISKNEAVLGEKIDYSIRFLLFSGTEIKTNIASFTFKPFRKLHQEPKIEISQRGNLIEQIYTFSTWIYDMPIKEEEKFSYSFPSFEIEAEYKGKKFKIEILPKKVRFVPSLSQEDLDKPLAVNFQEIQPRSAADYFNFFLTLAGGIFLLICGAGTLVCFFVQRSKRVQIREEKKKFEKSFVSLLDGLDYWANSKKPQEIGRKKIIDNAVALLLKIQNFFGILLGGEEADLRSKDIPYLIAFLEKDNMFFTEKEKIAWKGLLVNLRSIVYGDRNSETFCYEVCLCKITSKKLLSALAFQDKKKNLKKKAGL